MGNLTGDVKTRAKDPRPARTQAAIIDAIERLERSGSHLSVSNIVREAGISRSSFYTHFRDLDAVAVHLIAELYGRIEELDADLRPAVSGREATEATLNLLLDEITHRRHLYVAVLGSGVSGRAYRELLSIFASGARATMETTAPIGVDPDLAAHFLAAGTLATITWWITQTDPPARDTVQAQLVGLYPSWIITDSSHTPRATPVARLQK